MTVVNGYQVIVFYSAEDEAYVADVPDLRSCSAFGDTAEEAVHELEIAVDLWLETARAWGKQIPEPVHRPGIY